MDKLVYGCRKTYTHSVGLSVAFRQWRADTHCKYLHGYALKVELHFEASELDERNWVLDFGGLKEVKGWLEATFDHRTLIAKDDPLLELFKHLHEAHGCDLLVVEDMGMEAFAKMIWDYVEVWSSSGNGTLVGVSVSEHEGNMAYIRRAK